MGAYSHKMSTQLKNESPLGLGSVLVGSLPATLMTDDAPDRYTVEAVFTRKADRDEVAAIESSATHDHFFALGYPLVELRVSDRRLEIANTTLEELRDGLAAAITAHLADISDGLSAERVAAAGRFEDANVREQKRAAAVAILAASVTFLPESSDAGDQADRVEEWMQEGGAVRG